PRSRRDTALDLVRFAHIDQFGSALRHRRLRRPRGDRARRFGANRTGEQNKSQRDGAQTDPPETGNDAIDGLVRYDGDRHSDIHGGLAISFRAGHGRIASVIVYAMATAGNPRSSRPIELAIVARPAQVPAATRFVAW